MRSFLLIAMVIGLLSGCNDSSPAGKRPPQDHLVDVVPATMEKVAIERERTGTLRASQEIQIYNQEEGRITQLPFYEGDRVNKGDVVARLDDRLLQSQLARTQALRRKAEKDLERIRGLANKQLTSQAELTRVETDLAVARADEQTLLTRLDYATLRSPIDGLISQRLTEPGNIAERYSHLLTISDQSSLITEVTVSELLINKLQIGDTVSVNIDALEQPSQLPGTISRIYPNLDPVTRTGIVEIRLTPAPDGARPGQLARVILRTQEAERLLIPFVALRRDSAGEYIFVVENGVAKRTSVTSGSRIGNAIEIRQGLQNQQQVVIRGFTNLRDNKKVTVVNEVN